MSRGGWRGLCESWAAQAVLLLVASAALLGSISLRGERRSRVKPLEVPGADLHLSGAAGEIVAGSGLEIRELRAGERATALAAGLQVSAADFGTVTVESSGASLKQRLLFLWSPADSPGTLLGAPLAWSSGRIAALRLEPRLGWTGSVVALGVGVVGPVAAPWRLQHVTLSPRTAASSAWTSWLEWTSFEGLDSYSSNFVIGGSDRVRPRWRPVPAAAIWVSLALGLHLLACAVLRRRPQPAVAVALVLAGWVALDTRWQVDLWRQLGLTRERYAGRTWSEKRLAMDDADLFRFALEVKARLPAEPRIVYLVARDPERQDRFLQLRARYHLLPHNVSTYYSVPPRDLEAGEYLVVFGSRPDLAYDDDAGLLRVAADRRDVPVERLFTGPLGTLYRGR